MKLKKIPIIAFLIPFLILLLSFRLVVFDVDFYRSELEKYNVYERFDKEIADSAVENLIDYMKSNVPLSNFFNEKEKQHMIDVRGIIQKLLILMYVLLSIVVIAFLENKKYFFKYLFYGGIASLIVIFLFFIFSYIGFDFIFYKFHGFSFNNDFWKLNPEVDNLKALLPDGFFYDALIRIFFISSLASIVLVIVGFFGIKSFKYLRKLSK